MSHKLDRLESLMNSKSYDELSATEKNWVDQHYSRAEYENKRNTLAKIKLTFSAQQTAPNPAIYTNLRQKLKEQKAKSSTKVSPLYRYQIPAWQAVAAIAFLLFCIPQLRQSQLPDQEKIFIYQTDTVFKTIPAESIFDPIIDTLTDIPKVREILSRTNRSPSKASPVVFYADSSSDVQTEQDLIAHFTSDYDTSSIETVVNQYLKDSVKSYRVDVDTGFNHLGKVY